MLILSLVGEELFGCCQLAVILQRVDNHTLGVGAAQYDILIYLLDNLLAEGLEAAAFVILESLIYRLERLVERGVTLLGQ